MHLIKHDNLRFVAPSSAMIHYPPSRVSTPTCALIVWHTIMLTAGMNPHSACADKVPQQVPHGDYQTNPQSSKRSSNDTNFAPQKRPSTLHNLFHLHLVSTPRPTPLYVQIQTHHNTPIHTELLYMRIHIQEIKILSIQHVE
jgi:hypothetical protein